MDNLKDIQNITGLTSEAIFNIRKPVDYMCSDIDSHIKDIETQCDYIMDRDEGDVIYYSKSIKSDVDSYFKDIRSKVENLLGSKCSRISLWKMDTDSSLVYYPNTWISSTRGIKCI